MEEREERTEEPNGKQALETGTDSLKEVIVLRVVDNYSSRAGQAYALINRYDLPDEEIMFDSLLGYIFAFGPAENGQCPVFCAHPRRTEIRLLGSVEQSELTNMLFDYACREAAGEAARSPECKGWKDKTNGRRVTTTLAGVGDLVLMQSLYH